MTRMQLASSKTSTKGSTISGTKGLEGLEAVGLGRE
jgi:hypothetical protein